MKSGYSCCDMKAPLEARVPQEEVRRLYDSLSAIYDIWGRLTESKARERALELAAIEDGQSVLEVATGTGLAFEAIVKQNPTGNNIGIDISEGMLQKARQRLSKLQAANYELRIGSAFDIQYPPETFDILINNYMFDLIPFGEMDIILEQFKRVLKKDGKLVLVNMTIGERFGSGIYDLIYRISPKTIGGCRGVRLANRLQTNGFQVLHREYHQQLLFPSEVILAKKTL